MSRKKRKFERNIPDADKFINQLKYKDLKRECVIRGMEFDKIIAGDIIKLTNWLRNHFIDTQHHELLDIFDDYQDKLVRKSVEDKGQNPDVLLHPSLRLGYIAERDENGNVTKKKRVRTLMKKKKKKRERTEDGIFKGTKKAMTFELQQQGKTKIEVIVIGTDKENTGTAIPVKVEGSLHNWPYYGWRMVWRWTD